MKRIENLIIQDTSQPLSSNRALVPYKRVNAFLNANNGVGVSFRDYARSHLSLRPALAPLCLAVFAVSMSIFLYLNPAFVGDALAGKILSLLLLAAAGFQVIIATLRSLSVPIIGMAAAYGGQQATTAGVITGQMAPDLFQAVLVACALGVVARCFILRE